MQQKPRMAFGVNVDELTCALRTCSGKNRCDGCPYADHDIQQCGKLENTAAVLIRRMLRALGKSTLGHIELLNSLELCGTDNCAIKCEARQTHGARYCDMVQSCAAATIDRLYGELEEKWRVMINIKQTHRTYPSPEDMYAAHVYANALRNKLLSVEPVKITEEEKTMTTNLAAQFVNGLRESHTKDFLAVKSIEQSADHKTVMVLWKDGTKTKVVRSDNDADDIYMAFTAACAKKVFGNNTKIKKYIAEHLNEHKPRKKKEPEFVFEVVNLEDDPSVCGHDESTCDAGEGAEWIG